jgi:TolB protein
LTTDPGEDYGPAVSPDGTKVAYANYSSRELIVMNIDGSGKTSLATGYSPAWSPDGTKIVYTANYGDLYVMNADGTGQQLLIADGDDAAWSPDGSKIAFIRGRFLMTANPDGSGQTSIAEYAQWPSWSTQPAGRSKGGCST